MIIDGKQLRQEIVASLKQKAHPDNRILDIVYVGENKVIEKYIRAKERIGEQLDVTMRIHTFSENTTMQQILGVLRDCSLDSDGIIIQLPLPAHISKKELFDYLDPSLDVDLLSPQAYSNFLLNKNKRIPPVVRACVYIFGFYNVTFQNKNVCILGNGKLVGKPMADWCTIHGVSFTQLTKETFKKETVLSADIIISGIGQPHFVTPDMIKTGAVVIDAGTTEEDGNLLGDCHPDVCEVASLFTPVPGGVGPLTVVALFHNLFEQYEL